MEWELVKLRTVVRGKCEHEACSRDRDEARATLPWWTWEARDHGKCKKVRKGEEMMACGRVSRRVSFSSLSSLSSSRSTRLSLNFPSLCVSSSAKQFDTALEVRVYFALFLFLITATSSSLETLFFLERALTPDRFSIFFLHLLSFPPRTSKSILEDPETQLPSSHLVNISRRVTKTGGGDGGWSWRVRVRLRRVVSVEVAGRERTEYLEL